MRGAIAYGLIAIAIGCVLAFHGYIQIFGMPMFAQQRLAFITGTMPANNGVYSEINIITITVTSTQFGIISVEYQDDVIGSVSLTKTSNELLWQYVLPTPIKPEVPYHSFKFTVIEQGLTGPITYTQAGTYSITSDAGSTEDYIPYIELASGSGLFLSGIISLIVPRKRESQ